MLYLRLGLILLHVTHVVRGDFNLEIRFLDSALHGSYSAATTSNFFML